MPPNDVRALCVSIHDVSPHTWEACRRLRDAIRSIAPIPLTLLVVPNYHRRGSTDPSWYRDALEECLSQGDELALHGYSHLDELPLSRSWRSFFLRRVYTSCEGEFSAVDTTEAARRIALGLDWFAERRWPVHGFVAPAWLMSPGAWQALADAPFSYTTTFRRFHFLSGGGSIPATSMVYGARNSATRWFSRAANNALRWRLSWAPLLRYGLHPADARHPMLMRHLERLLESSMANRFAMTKSSFAERHRQSATTELVTDSAALLKKKK